MLLNNTYTHDITLATFLKSIRSVFAEHKNRLTDLYVQMLLIITEIFGNPPIGNLFGNSVGNPDIRESGVYNVHRFTYPLEFYK